MSTDPSFSFLVVTYNRRQEVITCVQKLIRQLLPQDEILVVDNGSTDGTVAALQGFSPRVRVVALERNYGPAGGRNRGAVIATGTFLVCLDDDAEILTPGVTTCIREYFDRDPTLGLLAFTILDPHTNAEEYAAIPRSDKNPPAEDYACSNFSAAGFAMRRAVFREVGMFWDRILYSGEELDLSYRLLDRGYRILHSRAIRVWHRKVPTARPSGQFVYHNARIRPLLALRYLPWPCVVSSTVLWWLHLGWIGAKSSELRFFVQGVWDAIRCVPAVLKERRCVSKNTVLVLMLTKGRLWW